MRVQPSLYLHPFPVYMIFTYFQSAHIHHYENCLLGTSNHGTYLFFPISYWFLYQTTTVEGPPYYSSDILRLSIVSYRDGLMSPRFYLSDSFSLPSPLYPIYLLSKVPAIVFGLLILGMFFMFF